MGGQVFLFLGQVGVGAGKMGLNLVFGNEEILQFLLENGLDVHDGDFVAAFGADIFWRAGEHIHLGSASAKEQAREELHGLGARGFSVLAGLEDVVALFPKVFGDNRLDRREHPIRFGLGDELAFVVAIGVIGPIHALGGGVLKEAGHGG